jgi:hypothetical protein
MERNREVKKLINVLHRIGRAASYATWGNAQPDAARFCAAQYNRVLARLTELEPGLSQLFTPLPEAASPHVTRIAARELVAYFEDEVGHGRYRTYSCGTGHAWFGWSPSSRRHW